MTFIRGETAKFTLAAKNRDGTALTSPESATTTIAFSFGRGNGIAAEFNSSPQVVHSGSATFSFTLTAADLAFVTGSNVQYDIWTNVGGDVLHQEQGTIFLNNATEPT
jgi:hypothetical protein